jgi:hypothetical protein
MEIGIQNKASEWFECTYQNFSEINKVRVLPCTGQNTVNVMESGLVGFNQGVTKRRRLDLPIAPSYMSPNGEGGGGLRRLSQRVYLYTWSPNKPLEILLHI